jgi:hypothetical protein
MVLNERPSYNLLSYKFMVFDEIFLNTKISFCTHEQGYLLEETTRPQVGD